MKINHEETKGTKNNQKKLRALRFFVVDFPREEILYRSFQISLLVLCALVLSQPIAHGQRKQEKATAAESASAFGNVESITAAQLKDYLHFVASDEMEGRDTPSRGLDITAKFIAVNLSRNGLKPVGDGEGHLERYFQKINLASRRLLPESSNGSINGN